MDVWFDIIPHILLDLSHIITCINLLCEDREYILFFNSCGLVREYPFPDYDASNCWSIIWWFFSDFRRTMTFHWTVIVALNTWSLGAGSMPVLVQLFLWFNFLIVIHLMRKSTNGQEIKLLSYYHVFRWHINKFEPAGIFYLILRSKQLKIQNIEQK